MPGLKRKSSSHQANSGCQTDVLGEFCWGSESRVGQIACSSQAHCGQGAVRKGSCSPRWMVSLFAPPQQLHSADPADTTVAVWEQNGNEMLAPPRKSCFFPLKLQRNSGNQKITLPIEQYFPASKKTKEPKAQSEAKIQHRWAHTNSL